MFVTLDFETYYAKDYTLKKLTTEEYIRDARFSVHGVGVKIGERPAVYFYGSRIREALDAIPWDRAYVLCHNTRFDAAILSWRYGIRPKFLLDTLSMARAVFPHESGSLANLSKLCGLGEKGNELVNTMGICDLTDEQQVALGRYCVNDVKLTYALFQKLKVDFPVSELKVIDQTLRMFTEPVLDLDSQLLGRHASELAEKRKKILGDRDLTSLRSNPQFAKLLEEHGVEPPTKTSLRTGKQTFAFSKTDEGMLALLGHENEEVQALAAARLGVKSSIEMTRTEAFLGIAERGALPIPLNYFGAQNTGRFAGSESVNLQNLPRGGALRKSIVAPEGYALVVSDFASIEARVLAWLAGQEDLLEQFRSGVDIYCDFASRVYGKEITKDDKKERFLGKVCLAEGSMVLCGCGWKPIESITLGDELWDGSCWVRHQGLLNNGYAQTLNLCGLWLTPDHKMWSGEQWITAQSVAADESILSHVLGTGAENLPLQGMFWESVVGLSLSSSSAIAKTPNTASTTTIFGNSKAHGVIFAQSSPERINATGNTRMQCQTTRIELDYLTDSPPRLLDATMGATEYTSITEDAVYLCTRRGGRIGRRFSDMYRRLRDGITQIWRLIGSTPTGTTNRGTLDSPLEGRTYAINEKSQTSRRLLQVYDIASVGPRNRFTVLTQKGPVIVHNCVLGLGYSMGRKKLASMMAVGPLGQEPILFSKGDLDAMGGYIMNMDCEGITTKLSGVPLQVHCSAAKHLVNSYREIYAKIPAYWKTCEKILNAMSNGVNHQFGCITTGQDYVLLPNGLKLQYKGLHKDDGWRYFGKRGEKQYLYSGKLAENLTQALARIVMTDAMLKVGERYKVVMTVHDELVCCVSENEADEALEYMIDCMSVAPSWCEGLPLAAEGGISKSYGGAK